MTPKEDVQRDKWIKDVLESFPDDKRYKAKRLLDAIDKNPDAEFNDRGEFVYKQTTIPLSHAIDLIADVLNTSKTIKTAPRGWNEFVQALRDVNVPIELVTNRNRQKYLQATEEAPPRAMRRPRQPRTRLQSKSVRWEEVEDEMIPRMLWEEQ